MCGTYGTTVGAGNHCANTPATSGPSANPIVMATAARRATVLWSASPKGGSDVSRNHTELIRAPARAGQHAGNRDPRLALSPEFDHRTGA
ncbi:MAG: hypothetical protein ACLP4R_28465 [Solirubrobacteraceae bacterium]